jgi:APA family basic amino acid/polyamine antiporter
LGLTAIRLVRRPQLYALAVVIAAVALIAHVVLIAFALPSLSFDVLREGGGPVWEDLAFALPLAMLAYTGLETVANLAAETREPGRTLPRSLFAGIGAVVVASFAVAVAALAALPVDRGSTDLASTWLLAPLAGVADELGGDVLRVFVAFGGVVVLLAAVSTSMSGAGRLSYSLARHGMLPHAFERLNRRTLLAPASIVSTAAVASALLIGSEAFGTPIVALASLYSFGILLAFTAAQLAVVRLRSIEPRLERPFRAPAMPFLGILGAAATGTIWILSLATHDAARIAGPIWIAAGVLVFVAVRRSRGEGLTERVRPAVADLVPWREGEYRRILVPLKLSPIGDEVLATAIRLAEERGGSITVLHVVAVPLDQPLDAALYEREDSAMAALDDARELAAEHGIDVDGVFVRARSIGAAVVEQAEAREADLIVMGSSPRWRRQSRFFSPTVDYVLRKAPAEVMVIAFPQGILESGEAEVAAS